MFKNKSITVVMPCKNEESAIGKTIKSIPRYIDEIIVVDNGSTDNTSKVASKLGALVISEPRIVRGIGYGFAHITGINNAKGDYIVGMDADDTYPSSEVANIISYMEKHNLDFVSCNRFPLKNGAITKTRQLGVKILNFETKLLYNYPIKDILTGMWIIRKNIVRELDLKEGDWNLSPEIKINAIQNPNINFGEYHIDHFEREGNSKQQIWKTGLNHLLFIFVRRFTKHSAIYRVLRLGMDRSLFVLNHIIDGVYWLQSKA